MPVIRCPKCGQAYDVPGVVAVRLPNAIATCHCGEWLAGSKAAVLARMLDPEKIKEIDLQPFRIDGDAADAKSASAMESIGGEAPALKSRSVRVVALGADQELDQTFTIGTTPLSIGSRGAHIALPDSGLAVRHCTISLEGDDLVLRDSGSPEGTLLDGRKIDSIVINDGVHLLQVGLARLAVEPTDDKGVAVTPLRYGTVEVDEHEAIEKAAAEAADQTSPAAPPPDTQRFTALSPPPEAPSAHPQRAFLVCTEGPLAGQEFEVPPTGLIVGREGHVRVPDEFLSRRHFQVTPDSAGAVRVKDLGSRNGTFLNTVAAQDTVVGPGDEIRAGVNAFRIESRA